VIISDSHRALFVHVQKTGGVTLTNVLKAQLDDVRSVEKRHAPLRRILAKEPALVDYWTFGFVRNPWDRMVSWWSMIENWRDWSDRKGIDLDDRWNPFWRGSSAYTSFGQFVLEGTEAYPRLRRNQFSYLNAGARHADFVGRTENLDADARSVLEHLGLDHSSIGHDNRSKRVTYREYYTPETRDRVGEIFAKDVVEYGYDF
jgi:hypothetical protein